MEVDLLQFVMGAGVDVRDFYKHIIKFFSQKYAHIHTLLDEVEMKKRFTHLRGVQKAVLVKYGRPLPGPVKYAKKKKRKPSIEIEVEEDEEEAPRGLKRDWEDMEEEEEVPQQIDGLSMLLSAAKQNGDLME